MKVSTKLQQIGWQGLLVLMAVWPVLAAQNESEARWLAALQTANGMTIMIQLADGHESVGTLLRGDGSQLVLHNHNGESMILRSEVRRLRMLTGRTRGRRAFVGSMIGLGAGAGLAAAGTAVFRVSSGDSGGNDEKYVAAGIGITGLGAGIGAAIGSALPNRYSTIYEAQ